MRWVRSRSWGLGLILLGAELAAAPPAIAAEPIQPQTTLTGELQSLASRASVVFAGQVVSIERRGGTVEIQFQVEQPVLGAVGGSFTLREWAGLWPPGQFRYQLGERALVFLHAASAGGFASPVDGANGVIPLVVQGASAPELLDVRRLAAALKRAPGTPLPPLASSGIALAEAIRVITPSGGVVTREPVRVLPVPVKAAVVQSKDGLPGEMSLPEPRAGEAPHAAP